MDKPDLNKQFSYRLRDAMLAADFASSRSTSGVCIHKLAEITGHSLQICRRYLRGEAIPDPVKIADIAKQLNVAPGWLLFGDGHLNQADTLSIQKNLLSYIVSFLPALYTSDRNPLEVSDFFIALLGDISQIHASEEQCKKIIDLALLSLKHFKR